MQEDIYTRKHLNFFVKALIFLLISISYVLMIFVGVFVEDFVNSLAYSINLNGTDLEAIIGLSGYFLSLVLIMLGEYRLLKKTDMSVNVLLFAPLFSNLSVIVIFICLHEYMALHWMADIPVMNMLIGLIGAVRGVIYILAFIKRRQFKKIALCILSVILCCSCFTVSEWSLKKLRESVSGGQSDLTSSWNSINQMIERDGDWQKIVTQTQFRLSEITETTDSYGYKVYNCGLYTYPNIDGSTVCVPMAVEFARQHLGFNDLQSQCITDFSTTHYAYMNLLSKSDEGQVGFTYKDSHLNITLGNVDLVIATHPSDEELKTAQEMGVELLCEPVCYDAFVFITHKDNPVESLTVQQVKDIYSGKIKNWKEVGGKDEKIRAFQRNENSGSQTAMENLVMGGRDMIDPIEVIVVEGMGQLVEAVAEYDNKTASIGYTYRYYIDNLYKNDEIKTIAIEGIAPTDDNIRSFLYPYTTNYYGVIRKEDENNTGGNFLRWMLSEEGQKCIAQAGYISIK